MVVVQGYSTFCPPYKGIYISLSIYSNPVGQGRAINKCRQALPLLTINYKEYVTEYRNALITRIVSILRFFLNIRLGVKYCASLNKLPAIAVTGRQRENAFLVKVGQMSHLLDKTSEIRRKTKAKTLLLRIINIMLRQARKVKRYNRYLGAFKDRADILYLAEYIFQVQEWEEAKRKAKENIRLHQFGSARMNSSEPTEDPAEYIFQVQEWEDLKQQAKASQLSGLKNQNSIPI